MLAQETAAVSPAPTVEPEPSWRKPVQGELTAAYSPDELQWNETLSQWRTHGGVDFSADTGSVVMAAADGVISAAYKDDLMGYTVEITHSGGWVSHTPAGHAGNGRSRRNGEAGRHHRQRGNQRPGGGRGWAPSAL